MNILLYGDDNAVLRDKLIAFKKQFQKNYPDGEIITLYGDELPTSATLADLLTTDSLFGSKKLFILKGVLGEINPKEHAELADWLITGGTTHTIIYYEEDNNDAVKSGHITVLQKQAVLDNKYIFLCRKGRGIISDTVFTPEQKMYLDQVHGQSSALAQQEIAKAQLLQRAGHPELINNVFNDYQLSLSVFPFIDCIFLRNGKKAYSLLLSLLSQGENELMLMTMLINHLKKILFLLDAEAQKADLNALLKKMRVHAFVAQKLQQQKRNFTLVECQDWLKKLLEIDLQAKQGKVDAKVALGQFCVSIGM